MRKFLHTIAFSDQSSQQNFLAENNGAARLYFSIEQMTRAERLPVETNFRFENIFVSTGFHLWRVSA